MRKLAPALVLGLVLASPRLGAAQEVAPDPKGQIAKEGPGRYFSVPVDFWKAGITLKSPPQLLPATPETAPTRVAIRESVWAQPIRTPDGNWMVYVPPKQVLDFLETPSEESARAYLAWKAEQTEKLRHAMLLLAKMKDASASPSPQEAPGGKAAAKAAPPDFPFRVTYFKKPSCPHCVSQDAILAEWLTRRSAGKLEVVLPGDRPELWKTYQVRGTPTLVLEAEARGRKEVLVGLQSDEALEATLARLALPPPIEPAEEPKKEHAR